MKCRSRIWSPSSTRGSYELVQGETPTATDAVMLVDYSHKVCTLSAADGSASITGTLVDVQDDALTMTLNGQRCPDGAHHQG